MSKISFISLIDKSAPSLSNLCIILTKSITFSSLNSESSSSSKISPNAVFLPVKYPKSQKTYLFKVSSFIFNLVANSFTKCHYYFILLLFHK